MPKSDKKVGMVEISKWQFGGLAHSKWSGTENSLYKMVGLDPHSTPGILKVEQKLTKHSDSTIDGFCDVAVNSSRNIRYWFHLYSGKIWQEKAGSYSLVYTTSPAAGAAGCYGACEYNGYIYWATASRLHRIPVDSADGAAQWTANAVPNWATFSVTDTTYHSMKVLNQVLYIADGRILAQVDGSTFSAEALDIQTPHLINCLGNIGTDLLIGTYVADNISQAQIIRWNTWSVSYTSSDTIPESSINAFLPADNMVLAQAGTKGNIYYYDGTNLQLYMKIPGDYTASDTGMVRGNSVAIINGQILLGFGRVLGNPTYQGVYRLARHDMNFPYILDMPYPISERSGGDLVLSGLAFGPILAVGNDLYVFWLNGSSVGVDKLDTSNKLNGAYFETRVISANREENNNFSDVVIGYSSLPASTDVSIYQDINYAGYGSALEKTDDTDKNVIQTKNSATEFSTMQVKVKMTTSSNSAPEIENMAVILR